MCFRTQAVECSACYSWHVVCPTILLFYRIINSSTSNVMGPSKDAFRHTLVWLVGSCVRVCVCLNYWLCVLRPSSGEIGTPNWETLQVTQTSRMCDGNGDEEIGLLSLFLLWELNPSTNLWKESPTTFGASDQEHLIQRHAVSLEQTHLTLTGELKRAHDVWLFLWAHDDWHFCCSFYYSG
jgi:hypothetical protein